MQKNKRYFSYLFSLLTTFYFICVSNAQIEIDITGGEVRGIPTAVVPFRIIDVIELDHSIHQIVGNDLATTGKFEIIDPNNFLSFPSRAEEFRAKDWRSIGAEALVMGEVWKLGRDNYEVQFRIFDVARNQQIGKGKRIPNLRSKDLRTAAHIISDSVVKAFTGKGAAFDSSIAYIQRSQEGYRTRFKLMVADWDGYGANEVYASWQPLLSPAWSPDGSKIAFVSFTRNGPIVQVLQVETGRTNIIADFKGVNAAPAWSPDGRKLAYSTSKDGSPDVYIYDFDTEEHQRITQHYGIDTEPAWSIDGKHLLFTSNRSRKPQIYKANLDDLSITRLTFIGKENASAMYDSAGKKITLVHEGGAIVTMQANGEDLQWLTDGKYDESPSFSPNGEMVMYATEQGYQPVILVASSDGRVRTRLNLINGDVREPVWSSLRR